MEQKWFSDRESSSTHERFGKRVVIDGQLKPEFEQWDYLRHRDGPAKSTVPVMEEIIQGLHTTSFHKGRVH